MAKHTYGFPAATGRAEAVASAVERARRDGLLDDDTKYSVEIVETDEHRNAVSGERLSADALHADLPPIGQVRPEFAVVIRTDR